MLIKIGTALISRGNRLNYRWLRAKVREIAGLCSEGHQIVLVSSGAVAAGMEIDGLAERPKDTLRLQMLSGMGQIRLMKYYKDYFKAEGIRVAQILLTHHNFSTASEEATIRAIIGAYLQAGVIAVVNENDMVNKEEVEVRPVFTDNDILAAMVAKRMQAELLLILTDVDGLFQGNPKKDAGAQFVAEVAQVDARVEAMAAKETNRLGLGGMASKVRAAKLVAPDGVTTIVANGRYSLADVLQQRVRRTVFLPARGSGGAG
jgi:glutamate 5-kinase